MSSDEVLGAPRRIVYHRPGCRYLKYSRLMQQLVSSEGRRGCKVCTTLAEQRVGGLMTPGARSD